MFPKGTIIHVTAFYDNTKANKNNPDPDQWVGYGDRTVDEMAHAWMNVVYLSDADYRSGWPITRSRPRQRRTSSSSAAFALRAIGALDGKQRGARNHSCPGALSASEQPHESTNCAAPVYVAGLAVGGALLSAQVPQLPARPQRSSSAPASRRRYDGWFDNPDGTHSFLIGYYSRNTRP